MQNILNITLNNNLKDLALLSLSPKPANTGLSSICYYDYNSKGQGNIFFRQLSQYQICCKELNNLYSGLSTRRRTTETTHTYIKSRTFLYTSNNHKENTFKRFTLETKQPHQPRVILLKTHSQDSDQQNGDYYTHLEAATLTLLWGLPAPLFRLHSCVLSSPPDTSFASRVRPQTVLCHCSQATDYRQVASTSITPAAL